MHTPQLHGYILGNASLALEVASCATLCAAAHIQQLHCLPPTDLSGAQMLNTFVDQSPAIYVHFSHTWFI